MARSHLVIMSASSKLERNHMITATIINMTELFADVGFLWGERNGVILSSAEVNQRVYLIGTRLCQDLNAELSPMGEFTFTYHPQWRAAIKASFQDGSYVEDWTVLSMRRSCRLWMRGFLAQRSDL